MTRIGTIALSGAGIALLLYLLVLSGFFMFQRSFFYPAPTGAFAIPPQPEKGFEEERLGTSDGLELRAFHHPARSGMPSLIFFHGNGDSLVGAQEATRALAAEGYGVLLPEYRGYGGNPGSPTEQGLYRDGDAALRWLEARGVDPGRIILIGNSLGSGVATELAARNKVGGLILVSGFASLVRVVGEHFPYFPASLLVRDRYENAAKLSAVTCPVLVLHGTADAVAPVGNGVALASASRRATLELEEGVGHELVYLKTTPVRLSTWLRSLPSR